MNDMRATLSQDILVCRTAERSYCSDSWVWGLEVISCSLPHAGGSAPQQHYNSPVSHTICIEGKLHITCITLHPGKALFNLYTLFCEAQMTITGHQMLSYPC